MSRNEDITLGDLTILVKGPERQLPRTPIKVAIETRYARMYTFTTGAELRDAAAALGALADEYDPPTVPSPSFDEVVDRELAKRKFIRMVFPEDSIGKLLGSGARIQSTVLETLGQEGTILDTQEGEFPYLVKWDGDRVDACRDDEVQPIPAEAVAS
jgi:hypothetical protein